MAEQETVALVRELSQAFGPSGFEDEVVAIGRREGEKLGEVREDSLRNLYIYRRENTGEKPVVLLDAHSDKVGLMVQYVHENGLLQFVPLGGWSPGSFAGHAVRVRNREGQYIRGVIASVPPHFMKAADKGRMPEISDYRIDVGASSAREVEERLHIGVAAPVVPETAFHFDEERGLFSGKAFDCRVGCAAVLETLRRLQGEALDVDVVGSFSSQEEVGERGARAVAHTVKPAVALVFEGAPADDTFTPSYAIQTALGKGPMLRHFDRCMITHPRLIRHALQVGYSHGIPVQEAVRTGGGTDGGIFHLQEGGAPSVVIGQPVRYIHAPYGIASAQDFENGVRLAVELVKSLTRKVLAGL